MNKMFCFQCQETAGCSGCTINGVCGKKAATANGKTFEWIKNEYPKEYDKLCIEGFDYRYPNGENAIDAYEKNKRAIEYILEDMEDDSTAIICAHGGSIRNILSYMLCGKLENHWNFKIENAKITVLEYDYGFSVLTKLNY